MRASRGGPHWVFSGDTERNAPFWDRVNALDVGALVIETAFSNREQALAERSLHLSPASLADELAHIGPGKCYPNYITHTKPAETEEIMSQIDAFAGAAPMSGQQERDIRWLETSGAGVPRPATDLGRLTIFVSVSGRLKQVVSHLVTQT